MKKLRDGEVVQGFDATLVSRVQNVQDTYKRLQQYLLDQKKAVEEQQAGLLTRQAEVPDTNEEHLQQEEVFLSAQDDFADVGSDGSEYQGGENSENSESSELSDSRVTRAITRSLSRSLTLIVQWLEIPLSMPNHGSLRNMRVS